jgi:uncharacterized protein (TIGR03067 family)
LEGGDTRAATTMVTHLAAAAGMSTDQVRAARFRLADAQSAVARQTGFASWPKLARHVEQLRSLEGTWAFESLEVEGNPVPPVMIAASRLLIDGDRFRTQSPQGVYEGVFNINVDSDPHEIDIEFVAGPEAGNWNYGLFRFVSDRLHFCLDMTGKGRPKAFATSAGTGHAFEILRRVSPSRPEDVTGGTPTPPRPAALKHDGSGFEYQPSPTLERLQGEWAAESIVLDGQTLPPFMVKTGTRSAKGNEVTIAVGGKVVTHVRVRIDETTSPLQIDYFNLEGPAKGTVQHGIMEWQGNVACVCIAASGQNRPTEFSSLGGSGRILSRWRKNP